LLVRSGADVNIASSVRQTPLMAAVIASDFPVQKVKTLLDAHANVNLQDKNGDTALMKLARRIGLDDFQLNDQLQIVSLLRAKGARTNLKNSNGKTALDLVDPEVRDSKEFKKIQKALR